jgi:3-hydroxy-3-methylglutaryl CoA synthase
MRGIAAAAAYVPRHRLDRSSIAAVFGTGGGRGTRAVASYDEDTTTLGVEAARLLRRGCTVEPAALWFATADPTYLEKTNACAVHAALRLDGSIPALDVGGAVRSGLGALLSALHSTVPTLVVAADRRGGLPTSADESTGGDGAAALLVADEADAPVLAEVLATGSATREVIDRWRTPGEPRTRQWEERLGEGVYLDLGRQAWDIALKGAGLTADDIDHVVVAGPHARACGSVARALGTRSGANVDDLASTVGSTGTAHAAILLVSVLEAAAPDQTIAVVGLADGADVVVLRTTEAIATHTPARPVAEQLAAGLDLPYGRFLAWRGMVTPEPPRRPEPARVSASAAARNEEWKYGFVVDGASLADATGTIVTFTIDRMAWSPSPPVVFAVVDLDDGRRVPLELTDVDAGALAIGDHVEMTFRRLSSADGIHNYFWKARPIT